MSMPPTSFFISDVHLTLDKGEWELSRRERLYRFFELVKRANGQLFIIGDFFDFWFEYKHVVARNYLDVLFELRQLQLAGIKIHFVLGNHDWWTRDLLTDYLGIQVYTDATIIDIDGQQVYLTHGDGLLKHDGGYRLLKRIIRHPIAVFLYRWLHPDIGIALAQNASQISRRYNTGGYGTKYFDELTGFAKTKWAEGNTLVVMGHYHLNQMVTEDGNTFACLGDWISQFTYGKLQEGNFTLEHWD